MATLATWEYGPRMECREGAPAICFYGVLVHYRRSRSSLRRARRIWITVHDKQTGPDNVRIDHDGHGWLTDLEALFPYDTDSALDRAANGVSVLYLQVWYED